MDEPSLLDYLKSQLNLSRLFRGEQNPLVAPDLPSAEEEEPEPTKRKFILASLPWRSLLALGLALSGQRFFEPGAALPRLGIGFYLVAGGLLVAALLKGEWTTPE
ncbi:MAG TPA: hypothetical protein PLX29_07365, partial [Anaerolineaceae bacterium]|nr:hypothetical protein [Anaerolineaceae bacterium]